MTGIGIDLIENNRIKKFIESKTTSKLLRVFTQKEITYANSSINKIQRFAARFAAKEAFFKAAGFGKLSEIEIDSQDKKPYIVLYGDTKKKWEQLSCPPILISISHTEEYATAVVIIL